MTLLVSNEGGSSYASKTVNAASPACVLTCSADVPPTGVVGTPVSFVATSLAPVCSGQATYSWAFGDNTSDGGSAITHIYQVTGLYNWTLSITQDGSTCTRNGSVTVTSTTSTLPVIESFIAEPDQISVGGTSLLRWSVRNAASVELESFGSVATHSETRVEPAATTRYKLIATNSAGSQTATVTVRVDPNLAVSIRADRTTGTIPLSITFTALVSGGVPPYQYRWSFGDAFQPATHRWTTPTAEDVTCTVTDAHGTVQKSNSLHIVSSAQGAAMRLDFVDVVGPGSSAGRTGASADGATVVEVRALASAAGTVTFNFKSKLGSGFDGGLFESERATGSPSAKLVVPTKLEGSNYVAEVFYKVPEDFANSGSSEPDGSERRSIHFNAHLDQTSGGAADSGDVIFYLYHAPVLFMHGIWSGSATWEGFPVAADLIQRAEALAPDWDGVSSIGSASLKIEPKLRTLLESRRSRGIAASQVDIVAHSMGGLIARRIVADGSALVHKLITVDTPHFGSALADFIFVHRDDFILKHLFIPKHPIDKGAIDDLRVSVGRAARARGMGTGTLRAHSIIGVASDDEPCRISDDNQLPRLVYWMCQTNSYGFPSPGACMEGLLTKELGGKANDEVVDTDSQRGGLSSKTMFFSAFGQHLCTTAHTLMTSNAAVSNRVRDLLNTSVSSGSFEKYSPASASAGDAVEVASIEAVPHPTSGTPIHIQSPASGQSVLPGSALEVVISDATLTDVLVVTPDDVIAATGQPLKARIDIPATVIGEYTIGVIGTFAGETARATATTSVHVVPNAATVSLILSPVETFMMVGDSERITVRAIFADGISREITGAATVTYSSSNISVAIVRPDGTLLAVGPGQASVTATAGDASGQVAVSVEAFPRRRSASH